MKKLTNLIAYALLFSLLLTSCGKTADAQASADAVGEVDDVEYEWAAKIYTPDYAILTRSLTSYGNSIYYLTIDPDNSNYYCSLLSGSTEPVEGATYNEYYRWDIDKDAPEKLPIGGHAGVTYDDSSIIQPDGKGNLYIVIGNQFVGKYDENGNELFYVKISPENVTIDTPIPMSTAVDSDGNLYITYNISFGNNVLLIYDSDGNLINDLNIPYTSIMYDDDSNLYGLTEMQVADLVKIDSNGTVGDVYLSDFKALLSTSYARRTDTYVDGKIATFYESSMYVCDSADNSSSELFKWSDVGIDQDKVTDFRAVSSGAFAVLLGTHTEPTYCNSIAIVSQIEKTDKTVLTLGVLWADFSLLTSVANFNLSHDDCKVEVKQYYDSYTKSYSYSDAITQFHLDIASGNCPDIMCLDYEYLENYAQKGLFTDLNSYLETSGISITQNILDSYTFCDELVSIPPSMDVLTMVMPSDVIGGKTTWTLDEMMEFIAENDNTMDDVPILNAREDLILKYCLRANLDQFVDWDNYTCDFENDYFYSLLEFCHQYGTETSYSNPSVHVNMWFNDAIAYEASICVPTDDIVIRQFLGTDDVVYIGYPTNEETGNVLDEAYGSLSIFSGSEHKDLAWEFISYILSEVPSYDPTNGIGGFPVSSDVLSRYADLVTEEPVNGEYSWSMTVSRKGVPAALEHPPTREEFATIENLLSTATIPSSYDSTIMDVILENAQDYFDGIHDTAYVASQIQSRVSIYLSERQ